MGYHRFTNTCKYKNREMETVNCAKMAVDQMHQFGLSLSRFWVLEPFLNDRLISIVQTGDELVIIMEHHHF